MFNKDKKSTAIFLAILIVMLPLVFQALFVASSSAKPKNPTNPLAQQIPAFGQQLVQLKADYLKLKSSLSDNQQSCKETQVFEQDLDTLLESAGLLVSAAKQESNCFQNRLLSGSNIKEIEMAQRSFIEQINISRSNLPESRSPESALANKESSNLAPKRNSDYMQVLKDIEKQLGVSRNKGVLSSASDYPDLVDDFSDTTSKNLPSQKKNNLAASKQNQQHINNNLHTQANLPNQQTKALDTPTTPSSQLQNATIKDKDIEKNKIEVKPSVPGNTASHLNKTNFSVKALVKPEVNLFTLPETKPNPSADK